MAYADGHYLIGLIGSDVHGSLSPSLFEHEADALGLRLLYRTIDVEASSTEEEIGALVRMARRMRFNGLNVTHPCKQTIIGQLDGLSPDAAALQAVNTVALTDGGAIGHNTDWSGFADCVERELPAAATGRVILVGCGGAGAAVGHAMLTRGTELLVLVDAEHERAVRLAGSLARRFGAARVTVAPDVTAAVLSAPADGLVNATPVGMVNHPGTPVPLGLLHPGMWVVDIIYRPLETPLLRHARALGCRTLNGGGMLVHQAARGFHLLTGHTPDAERMLRGFRTITSQTSA